MRNYSSDEEFLVFTVAHQKFALPHENLIRIIDVPATTAMPHMPPYARGCINVEDAAVPLYDVRKKFGVESLKDEMSGVVDGLLQRKQDHLNWIAKLKDSVNNATDITVETDPHKCAFGRWYDSFRPDSVTLANYMYLFDAPHKQIHELAVTAGKLIEAGRDDEAKGLIRSAELKTLKRLLELFDGAGEFIRRHTYEYAVILMHNGGTIALAIDRVDAFERLEAITADMPGFVRENGGSYINSIARRTSDSGVEDVFILNVDNMLESCLPAPGTRGQHEPVTHSD